MNKSDDTFSAPLGHTYLVPDHALYLLGSQGLGKWSVI